MARSKPPLMSSVVPATIFGLAAAATPFFPPEQLWSKLAVVGFLALLSAVFFFLKHAEDEVQDEKLRALQKSIDDLVRDLRVRDQQILQFQQQGRPKPLVVLEYDTDFEKNPEHPFVLRNVGDLPALNISLSPIAFESCRATFESVPNLAPGERVELLPDLDYQGLVFQHRLRDLLDKVWHKTRWIPGLSLSKPEIEELFDRPVTFTVQVRYLDPLGNEYSANFELVYIYFAARAFVRLLASEPGAG